MRKKLIIIELIVFVLVLTLDLISKHYVVGILPNPGDSKVIIPGILTFIYTENYGASFGLFSGMRTFLLILTIVTCVIILGYLIFSRKADILLRLSLTIILGGALGNIFDRLTLGYVRDFIDYTFLKTYFNFSFAIVNVADIFLTIGAILLLIYVIFFYKDTSKKVKLKEESAPLVTLDKDIEQDNNIEEADLSLEPKEEMKERPKIRKAGDQYKIDEDD